MLNNSNYIQLLRPSHWVKNLIIALPLLLSMQFNSHLLTSLFLGFLSFSLLASGSYILNDIKDIENDRLHLVKKKDR